MLSKNGSTMVKKKGKSAKKLRKRASSWTEEDVPVHTSLPPQVEGQLRCYLKLCVNQILWMVPNSPDLTQVRVQWWGEPGEGAIFRPIDVKKAKGQTGKTTARYAIRSGPKQFAAYLSDCGSLVFEVLSCPLNVTVGRAQVDQIGLLAPNRPINGFFPVFSADSEKIGELQVSIMMESLMAAYDSTSSAVPTPDMSLDAYTSGSDMQPVIPPQHIPISQPVLTSSGLDDPFTSPHRQQGLKTYPAVQNEISRTSQHLFSPLRTDPGKISQQPLNHLATPHLSPKPSREDPAKNLKHSMQVGAHQTTTSVHHVQQRIPVNQPADVPGQEVSNSGGSTDSGLGTMGKADMKQLLENVQLTSRADHMQTAEKAKTIGGPTDVLTALIDKGKQLRKAMIHSTVDVCPIQDSSHANMTPQTLPATFSNAPSHRITENFFKQALKELSNKTCADEVPIDMIDADMSDVDSRTVDLIMGDNVTSKELQLLRTKVEGSPASSVSGDDGMDALSDLGDPVHEESILEELFYKEVSEESDVSYTTDEDSRLCRASRSNSLASLEDLGNRRPPSRSSTSSLLNDQSSVMTPVKSKKKTRSKRKSRSKTPTKAEKPPEGRKKSKKTSRSRSGSGSRSRRRGSVGTVDTDSMSRSSDVSRVSFDPTPSDAEEQDSLDNRSETPLVDGLSVERLTLLGRVHVARVMVDRLALAQPYMDGPDLTPRKKKQAGKGRPPRPLARNKKPCTYFVEYQFPVVATSRDKYTRNAMATEVTRVASKRVADGVVTFSHRSVFPVVFDGESVEKWWKAALVFKVYARTPGLKIPTLLGTCSIPLKSVLKAEALYLDKNLDVKDRSSQSANMSNSSSSSMAIMGSLKVSVELASDSKDFSTALARTRLAEMKNAKIVPISQRSNARQAVVEHVMKQDTKAHGSLSEYQKEAVSTQTEPQPTNLHNLPFVPPPSPAAERKLPLPGAPAMSQVLPHSEEVHSSTPYEVQTFHTLLMVPEGQNISLHGIPSMGRTQGQTQPKPLSGWTGRDMATRNLYIVCRMFWCDDVSRSNICWGTVDPQFNFIQVAPVLMTTSLLERLRNNFVIIEVWDKKTSSENDQLVGLVKLPLHQFYMSYRDRRITNSLLKSQYPVISVDSTLPVVNPVSGAQFGQLQVVLAMGNMQQITTLQKVKTEGTSAFPAPERPDYHFERQDLVFSQRSHAHQDNQMLEHVFELSVVGVKGLKLFEDMIWGEADCFVQYHFPSQQQTKQQGAPDILQAMPTLKAFRTATTLCVPDPVFHDVTRHRIVLSADTPVQREILTACSGAGGGRGGVPFEIWCRYYHPNIRDQVIAKTSLPLAKLCAMVTMQKRGEPSVQTFTLPLSALGGDQEDSAQEGQVAEVGLLEVQINYKWHQVHDRNMSQTNPQALQRSLPNAQVCIAVSIIKASGLKASAMKLARQDAAMQYVSEVGVNSYVRINLSFLQKQDERITRTVARTFAPEYCCHLDFPVPLLWTEPDTDALSLAEILENAEAYFEVWHQVPSSALELEKHYANAASSSITAHKLVSHSGDVLLGTVTVPLKALLIRRTGITGWFSVNIPSIGWEPPTADAEVDGQRQGLERVVGGLELSIKFAHQEDLERVVNAARGVGWAPDFDVELGEWESMDEHSESYHHITVAVDTACFPLQNALIVGQTKLDKAAHCYVRYKLYDKGAICSKLAVITDNCSNYLTADLQHSRNLILPGSGPFIWYLREELLEVQVWVTYHPHEDRKSRPRNRDKLIGAAYIDLHSLADHKRRQHRISGIYPLFKPGAANLGGACLRAHVTMRPQVGSFNESDSDDENIHQKYSNGHESFPGSSDRKWKHSPSPKKEPIEVDTTNTFGVLISIERATRLPLIPSKDRSSNVMPSPYITYQTAESKEASHTDVFPHSSTPQWNYQHETRLTNQLLTQDSKNLVFKVWHKDGDATQTPDKTTDRVLGFVSVDLAPLTAGFHQLCGWYNIMDFNGICQGQIKIAITPQEPLLRFKNPTVGQEKPLVSSSHQILVPSVNQLSMFQEPLSQVPLLHFTQHYNNVKKYHENLSHQRHQMEASVPPDQSLPAVSRSALFKNLRCNMDELDYINNLLKQKLHQEFKDTAETKESWGSQEEPLPSSTRELTNILMQTDLEDSTPRAFVLNMDSAAGTLSSRLRLTTTSPGLVSTSQETGKEIGAAVLDSDAILQQEYPDASLPSGNKTRTGSSQHGGPELDHAHAGYDGDIADDEVDGMVHVPSANLPPPVTIYQRKGQTYNVASGLQSETVHVKDIGEQIHTASGEEDELETSVVVPRPLNNVSAFDFNNFVASSDQQRTAVQSVTKNEDIFAENENSNNILNGSAVVTEVEHPGHEAFTPAVQDDTSQIYASAEQPHDSFFGNDVPFLVSDEAEDQHHSVFVNKFISADSHSDSDVVMHVRPFSQNENHGNICNQPEEETEQAEVDKKELIKDEDPSQFVHVSRLAGSSGISGKKLNRKAARHRREKEYHKHAGSSSDSGDDTHLKSVVRARHRSKSKSSGSGSNKTSPKTSRSLLHRPDMEHHTDVLNSNVRRVFDNTCSVTHHVDRDENNRHPEYYNSLSQMHKHLPSGADAKIAQDSAGACSVNISEKSSSQLEKVQIGSSDYEPSYGAENDGLYINNQADTDRELLDELAAAEEMQKEGSAEEEQLDDHSRFVDSNSERTNTVENEDKIPSQPCDNMLKPLGMDGEITPEITSDSDMPQKKPPHVPKFKGLQNVPVPNFFMPTENLAQSMRALTLSATENKPQEDNEETEIGKRTAKREYLQRLVSGPSMLKTRLGTTRISDAQPDIAQTQRIAKIFSQKFS